ncbi:hypothetical protein TRFO_23103 [Tritrichomonas foetus]|uniref:Vps53 N-terminal domain-containing protein n=1 Tax=Tritrichomonas foetus TaxID=1144522 RepID=A0A1J4KBS1_9EUKA|nr:hypothetical protein TRFO_23103 [Tritrichomonas foetus]|eukprot:OHT08418.1 hypothetical protein TRFO_23103 [Tritrichomonas foetus]
MASSILDIDNIDTQLSTSDFNAVEYIDKLLPDDGSLIDLTKTIQKIQARMQQTTESIREAVRSNSVTGNNSEAILKDTQNAISDLSGRIQNIRGQAVNTENVVSQICKDIKPLDNAKKNLTTTVTTLRRLQMMTTTVKQLEINIEQLNYSNCAANILALTSFIEYFKKYETAPQLEPLLSKFYDLKRKLRNKINTELESKLYSGTGTEANLPICAVIDAYASDFRSNTIEMFCDKFLAPYEDAYRNSSLSEMQSRYQWFKQRADFFNRQYHCAFPKEWRMLYHLARVFCQKTTRHVKNILKNETQLDVKQYLRAFEVTVKFEQKMAESFATVKTVYIDENASMPDFENSAEGIRQKYAWKQRKEQHLGEIVKEPANEFIGIIACAFAPHIDIYLQAEKQNLEKIIRNTENYPDSDIDNQSKTMSSSTTLILAMKSCIDKCAGFNVSQSLRDLFKMLKGLLKQYVVMLTRIIPTRCKKDDHYILACCIANTSSLLLSIVDSLATKVKSLISHKKRRKIKVEDVKDSVGAELRKQLFILIDAIIKECETPLAQIGNNQWQPNDIENSRLPPKLASILVERFSIISEWLSNDNMNRLRTSFTQKVVAAVRDAMFRSKGVSQSAPRISITLKELKILVEECTNAESDFAKKRIDYEFVQIQTELIILCCPDIAMTVTYISKAPKPTKEHFLSIVRLRGYTSQEDQAKFSSEYDKQSAILKNELG